MNTIYKMLLAGLLSMSMLTVVAQPPAEGGHHHGQATEQAEQAPHPGCPMHALTPSVDLQSVKICYAPDLGAFVAVDSVECAVHMVKMVDGALDTSASFKTDNTHKRHDLKNILRPVSVSAMGPYVLVLASAVNDSAYVAILDSNLNELARRPFQSPMYAMHREHGVLMVVGRNPYGYDVNVLPLFGLNFERFATDTTHVMIHHYRVAKQSEKIKNSDPVGIGLTAVAVSVVFLALVCIALIIAGSGKLIANSEKRKAGKADKTKKSSIKPVSDGSSVASEAEVFAAIAAAIHLYNDELHDEEDTVITIQKVEREWTPWNAKYYNMNHYFNNRK